MKILFTMILTTVIAVVATTLFISNRQHVHPSSASERKLLFYQSPMHLWITSDKPGRCTICGMELVPIYHGDKGFDVSSADIISLNEKQIQVINVSTTEAKFQPLVRHLEVAGTIDEDPTRHRIISAYADGRINKLDLNYVGAEVEKGAALADLYSPTLLQAEREYRQLNGDLKHNTALRSIQMGLTPEQIDGISTKSPDALSSQIQSPMTGTVVKQEVVEGQYVTTGQAMFEIADFSTMWFQFIAYEQDLALIQIGQTVTIKTPSLPGKSFVGKISFIDPNIDAMTRATMVRVELPNPKLEGRRQLLRQMYADGLIQIDTPSSITVPRSAVIAAGPSSVVYVDQGKGAYKQVPVKTGLRGDQLIEITSGIKAGDRVVTNGNLLIDAQAELDRSFEVSTSSSTINALSADQQTAIRDFVKLADAMSAALGTDDLPAFNRASKPAMKITERLIETLGPLSIAQDKLAALDGTSHFHGAADLKDARIDFLKFNRAATDVLVPLRKWKDFPDMQIWKCPMVDQAVPGAKGEERWIQTGGRAIQNPYFGEEMQDCGDQIQP